MDTRLNTISTAVGAALLGLALVQPASAQQASPGISQAEPAAASPATTHCDALQGMERQDCLARLSSPSVTEGGAASSGATTAPRVEERGAIAPRERTLTTPRDAATVERDVQRGAASAGATVSRDPAMDATASAGATVPRSESGLAAEPAFQGASPANVMCDAQIGRARADCLVYHSAGPGLQQGSAD
jgi:hypothetical protein